MSDYYLDGDFSVRSQAGPEIISLDPITRAHLCRRTVYMDKDAYVPMRQPNSGITGLITRDVVIDGATVPMYFYEETQPRDTGSGILELDEFYAEIPATYIEPLIIAYEYQYLYTYTNGGTGYQAIGSTTRSTNAICVKSFGLIGYDNTSNLDIHIAARYESNRTGHIYTTGSFTYHSPGSTTNYLAQDSKLDRWHGPIFCRQEIFVEPYSHSLL